MPGNKDLNSLNTKPILASCHFTRWLDSVMTKRNLGAPPFNPQSHKGGNCKDDLAQAQYSLQAEHHTHPPKHSFPLHCFNTPFIQLSTRPNQDVLWTVKKHIFAFFPPSILISQVLWGIQLIHSFLRQTFNKLKRMILKDEHWAIKNKTMQTTKSFHPKNEFKNIDLSGL